MEQQKRWYLNMQRGSVSDLCWPEMRMPVRMHIQGEVNLALLVMPPAACQAYTLC